MRVFTVKYRSKVYNLKNPLQGLNVGYTDDLFSTIAIEDA